MTAKKTRGPDKPKAFKSGPREVVLTDGLKTKAKNKRPDAGKIKSATKPKGPDVLVVIDDFDNVRVFTRDPKLVVHVLPPTYRIKRGPKGENLGRAAERMDPMEAVVAHFVGEKFQGLDVTQLEPDGVKRLKSGDW